MSKTYRSIPYKKQSQGQQMKTTKRSKMTLSQALQEHQQELLILEKSDD